MAKKQALQATEPTRHILQSGLFDITTQQFLEECEAPGLLISKQIISRVELRKQREAYIDAVNMTNKRVLALTIDPILPKVKSAKGKQTLLVVLSDVHFGKSVWNSNGTDLTFSIKIGIQYLNQLFYKAMELYKEKPYLYDEIAIAIIGDSVEGDGSIFANQGTQLEKPISEQVQAFSEAMLGLIKQFDTIVEKGTRINIFGVPGNHGEQRRKDGGDVRSNWDTVIYMNMETILRYIQFETGRLSNVTIRYAKMYDSNLLITIKGRHIILSHILPANILSPGGRQKVMAIDFNNRDIVPRIDLVLTGHYHENLLATVGHTTVIRTGCLPGRDSFSNNLHLVGGAPSQVILAISEENTVENYIPFQFKQGTKTT